MGTPIILRTPMPTVEELADDLGIGKKRRQQIEKIAQSAVANYYAKTPKPHSKSKRHASRTKRVA
jgi:hypothetical protein